MRAGGKHLVKIPMAARNSVRINNVNSWHDHLSLNKIRPSTSQTQQNCLKKKIQEKKQEERVFHEIMTLRWHLYASNLRKYSTHDSK